MSFLNYSSATGLKVFSDQNAIRFDHGLESIQSKTLNPFSPEALLKDYYFPLSLLRDSIGQDLGVEDYRNWDFEDYLSLDRSSLLLKFLTPDGLKNHSYQGIEVPCPEGFYSHAVGPIHAGIIEPGHFRFVVEGEIIKSLDIRLGFQKRDVAKLLLGKNPWQAMPILESIASDSTIGYAFASARAFEKALNIHVPSEMDIWRSLLLEIERCAIHTADMGAMAGDVGFYPLLGVCSTDRGFFLGAMELLVGNRFGKGAIYPGSLRLNSHLQSQDLLDLANRLEKGWKNIHYHVQRTLKDPSFRERLQESGVVSAIKVMSNGFVGMVARSSGIPMDLRKSESSYHFAKDGISFDWDEEDPNGDAYSRFVLRSIELSHSVRWIVSVLRTISLPKNSILSKEPNQFFPKEISQDNPGFHWDAVEAWRGSILTGFDLDSNGRIIDSYLRDPSLLNWHALEICIRGEQTGDFPLNNKSMNLSYVGVDQ